MYLFLNSIQISKKNVKPRCGGDQATKFAQRENSVVHSSQKSAATLFRRAFLALCTTEFCLCANFVAWSTMHRVSHRNIIFFVLNYIVDFDQTEKISCISENEPRGHIIPAHISTVQKVSCPKNTTCFVIEKETIFYRLVQSGFVESCKSPVVLVTGHGMPDLPTRSFVQKLEQVVQKLIIICDYDPFGIAIAGNYAFPKNNAWHQQTKILTKAEIIALKPQDCARFGLSEREKLKLGKRDRVRASNHLQNLKQSVGEIEAEAEAESAGSSSQGVENVQNHNLKMKKDMIIALEDMLLNGHKYELDAISKLEELLMEQLPSVSSGDF